MEITNTKITRYERGYFYIDIIETGDEYEAWLTQKEYGFSLLMFGCPKEQQCYEDFCVMVDDNAGTYMRDYLYYAKHDCARFGGAEN